MPAALLRRELRFKGLAVIEAAGSAVQALTIVTGALLGFGVWALVAGPLAPQAFSSAAVMTQRRVPLPPSTARRSCGRTMTFTRHQLTGSVLWYWYSNADFLVAGKVLGEKALGLYYVAWNLSKAVPEKLTGLIVAVVPSYLSAIQDDPGALRRYLLRLTEVIALVTFPALVGIALLAGSIQADVLGPRWVGVAGPLRILALHSVLTSIAPLPSRVLTVRRETRFLVRMDLLLTGTLIPGFWIGSHWGVIGIAVAWISIVPIFQVVVLRRACRAIDLPLKRYLDSIWPAASMTAVMAVVVVGILAVELATARPPASRDGDPRRRRRLRCGGVPVPPSAAADAVQRRTSAAEPGATRRSSARRDRLLESVETGDVPTRPHLSSRSYAGAADSATSRSRLQYSDARAS